MLLNAIDSSEKVGKKFLCSRGWMGHHENVPNCSLYQVLPTLKNWWKSVQLFPVMLLTDRQIDRQKDRQTDRQTDEQTNRQSNGRRWKHNLRHGGGNKIYLHSLICIKPETENDHIRSIFKWAYLPNHLLAASVTSSVIWCFNHIPVLCQ